MKKGQKCPETPINRGKYGRQRKNQKKFWSSRIIGVILCLKSKKRR